MKVIVLGRNQNNDIVINDPYVSRTHAQVVFHDNGKVSVIDLGSKTGTYVNGQKIQTEVFLNPGDMVKIGNTIVPWQSYAPNEPSDNLQQPMNQGNVEEPIVEDPFEDDFEGNKSFFVKNKILIISFLSLLILGGGAFYAYKKGLFDKEKNEKKEEAKKEDENKLEALGDDENYYLMLPKGFEEVDDADDDADIQYANKKDKIYFKVVLKPVDEVKKEFKKAKEEKWLAKFKENDLKTFKKTHKDYKIKNDEETSINDMEAIKLTISTKENKKKISAQRVYMKGENNFYILYIYSKATKSKQKKANKKTIEDIINSFTEGTYEEDQGDDNDDNAKSNDDDNDNDDDNGDDDKGDDDKGDD